MQTLVQIAKEALNLQEEQERAKTDKEIYEIGYRLDDLIERSQTCETKSLVDALCKLVIALPYGDIVMKPEDSSCEKAEKAALVDVRNYTLKELENHA